MGLKILSIYSGFPITKNSTRNMYFWHSLEAMMQLGITPIALETQAWKPRKNNADDFAQFPIEIHTCRYLSIPRHYFRFISNFFYIYRVSAVIRKLIKKNNISVIHAHGEIAGLAAVAISKQINIPVVITIHGIDICPRFWSGYAGKMFRSALNNATRVVFVGAPLQKHFQAMLLHHEHCRIIHNGFRLPTKHKGKPSNTHTNMPIRIISVSILHEGKGVNFTLYALSELKKQGINNWVYTIIGNGDQKKYYKKIIRDNNLGAHIEWMGDCSHDRVYEELEKADIFCLPSYREAFGIAYVEAMAHGLLTIGVKNQGPQSFIEHGKTGFLVEPRDLNSLTNILRLAIINYKEIQKVAYCGQQHVLSNFTWKQHAEKLMALYDELIT